MDLRLYRDLWVEIYLVSNTPLYFVDKMRNTSSVVQLSYKPHDELIFEFYQRANSKITVAEELVEIYAIYIALTFKKPQEVNEFFIRVKSEIQYEWFPYIANYYLDFLQDKTNTVNFNAQFSNEDSQESGSGNASINYINL